MTSTSPLAHSKTTEMIVMIIGGTKLEKAMKSK